MLPVVLDTDSHALCNLRRVCKSFRTMRAMPVCHVSASTPRQIRSLATTFFQGWDMAAVQLQIRSVSAHDPQDMVAAACALPDSARNKIVSVSVPAESVAQLAPGLRQLEGVQHLVIHGAFTNPDCLPHVQRLELRDIQVCTPEMLVCPCRRRLTGQREMCDTAPALLANTLECACAGVPAQATQPAHPALELGLGPPGERASL